MFKFEAQAKWRAAAYKDIRKGRHFAQQQWNWAFVYSLKRPYSGRFYLMSTATLVLFTKRKKAAITLLKIMQISGIILAIVYYYLASQKLGLSYFLSQIIPPTLWLIYTFKSIRLKVIGSAERCWLVSSRPKR